MAIALFGTGSGFAGGGTTVNITTPASIPAGAVMVLTVGGFCTSATPTPSGSGWTNIDTGVTGSAGFWTWYKVASGGEGTITVTTDGAGLFGGGNVCVYTGVSSTSTIVAHAKNINNGVTRSSVTSPTVNNTVAGSCAVFSGAYYNGGSGIGQSTPTGMTEAIDTGDASSSSTFEDYKTGETSGNHSYSTTNSGGQSDWYGGESLLFLRVAASATNAPAGSAAATLTANAPTVAVGKSAAAGQASVTATANAPTTTLVSRPGAGAASVTTTANAPTVTTATQAQAGLASVAFSGNLAGTQNSKTAAAGLATVTLTAQPPRTNPVAGLATISFTVPAAQAAEGVPSGSASVSATAFAPTVHTVNIPMGAVQFGAYPATVAQGVPAGCAQITFSSVTEFQNYNVSSRLIRVVSENRVAQVDRDTRVIAIGK